MFADDYVYSETMTGQKIITPLAVCNRYQSAKKYDGKASRNEAEWLEFVS